MQVIGFASMSKIVMAIARTTAAIVKRRFAIVATE